MTRSMKPRAVRGGFTLIELLSVGDGDPVEGDHSPRAEPRHGRAPRVETGVLE